MPFLSHLHATMLYGPNELSFEFSPYELASDRGWHRNHCDDRLHPSGCNTRVSPGVVLGLEVSAAALRPRLDGTSEVLGWYWGGTRVVLG